MKVIFFGLDGASLQNLGGVMGRTQLRNFKAVMERGAVSPLKSIYPYVTAPAWTSIFTGVNPGKHGIYDMLEFRGDVMTPPNLQNCEIPFLWDYVTWAGKRILAMGVQFIHPAPTVNGVFVTGRFAPSMSCYPAETKARVDLSGFSYDVLAPGKRWKFIERNGLRTLAELELRMLQARKKASISLIDSGKWDMILLVESQPDELFHIAYDNQEIMGELFSILDSWLGELMGRMGSEDLLMIVSDHGFSEMKAKFHINTWLERNRYMARRGGAKSSILRLMNERWPVADSFAASRRAHSFLQRRAKAHLKTDAREPTSASYLESETKAGTKVVTLPVHDQVAWLKILQETTQQNETSASLFEDLQALKKAGILKSVLRTSDLYSGKKLPYAPGPLLVEVADGYRISSEPSPTRQLLSRPDSRAKGTHRLEGLVVLLGPRSFKISGTPCLYDVLPTVLKSMKLPVPSYVDGAALQA
jgi:predicted AlkP superfamily phosphohydrolase/phosphomutase